MLSVEMNSLSDATKKGAVSACKNSEGPDHSVHRDSLIRSQGYKTFFMLNSTEHEICPGNKSQISDHCKFFLAKHS